MAQAEGVIPSQEELLAELQALKLAHPEMGAKTLHAALKEKNPTWLASLSRVKKVANLMSEALVLYISGATGINAAGINGAYDRTSETSGGYALYRKRGGSSMCMEHFGGKWRVRSVSYKGKDTCFAWVAGGCGAEACTSR